MAIRNTPPLTRHNGDLAMTATQADWKDTPFNKPFNMMEESSRFHKWLAAGSGLLFLAMSGLLLYQILQLYGK
ncbi:MAG: hypothetical protein KF814_04690 [Nitrospiraceae bacterium]|nr:hypothetical protein [Nitrospiraceae bacterium]